MTSGDRETGENHALNIMRTLSALVVVVAHVRAAVLVHLSAVIAWKSVELRDWVATQNGLLRDVSRIAAVTLLLVVMAVDRVALGGDVGPSSAGSYLVAAGTAMVLVAFLDNPGRNSVTMERLGRSAHVSYSLYAIHFPVLVLAVVALKVNDMAPSVAAWLTAVAITLLCIAVAAVFGYLTERNTEVSCDVSESPGKQLSRALLAEHFRGTGGWRKTTTGAYRGRAYLKIGPGEAAVTPSRSRATRASWRHPARARRHERQHRPAAPAWHRCSVLLDATRSGRAPATATRTRMA